MIIKSKVKTLSLILAAFVLIGALASCSDFLDAGANTESSNELSNRETASSANTDSGVTQESSSEESDSVTTGSQPESSGSETDGSQPESSGSETEGSQPESSGSETEGSQPESSGSETDSSKPEDSVTDTQESQSESETNMIIGDEVEYASAFTVSKVFTSDMVIQRNEYVRVWGFADESENGKKVSASFMGERADAIIENGEWEIVFCQMYEANKELGNNLRVYGADGVEFVFEDILIGDVFMVIGQSNVQYDIAGYLSSEPNLKWTKDLLRDDSIIRFNYNSNTQREGYPTIGTDEICKDVVNDFGWVKPDADNINGLSAIGYFIAHQITELTENGIPVGIAQFSANGRPLSVFMPNELAEELGSDYFSEEKGIYIDNYYAHVEARYMYNQYIMPFEKMPIAGIVWYQGEAESNSTLSSVYVERFTALMEYMRSTHNLVNEEFPVFFVEYPSVYKVEGSGAYLDTGMIRATVGMIPNSLSNSYVAVCSDLWNDRTNDNNIHPYCKYEQAERVTDLMQAVIYGTKTLDEATGPILVSYEFASDKKSVVLKFTNYGEGLTTSDGGTEVLGFGGMDNSYGVMDESRCSVTATITAPDTVTVVFSRRAMGVAYNYVAANFFGVDVNLCDSYGNPAKGIVVYLGK